MHIDVDEGRAAGVVDFQLVELLKEGVEEAPR
jgi:hypothetical protein